MAQPVPKPPVARRPQRVAVIGAGHYHATLAPFYLRILQNEKVDIVGVHDPDRGVAEDRAKRCGSTAYTDYRAMIDKTKPDFVLSLNRHVDMPAPFRFLVDSGIPFLAEKPWGIDDKTVNELADYAEKKNAWATAPMSFRYSWWAETARKDRPRQHSRHGHIRLGKNGNFIRDRWRRSLQEHQWRRELECHPHGPGLWLSVIKTATASMREHMIVPTLSVFVWRGRCRRA